MTKPAKSTNSKADQNATKTHDKVIDKKKKEVASPAAPAPSASLPSTIYVEGLPFEWTEEDIRNHFSSCGEISRVKAPTWHDTGRLKGYCIIDLANQEGLDAALSLNGSKVGSKGRYLKVEKSTSSGNQVHAAPTSSEESRTLFIGNLPYEATEDQISNLILEKLGKVGGERGTDTGAIHSVRIVTQDGRSKGFAYVDFASVQLAKKVHAAGLVLLGRTLKIDFNTGKQKAGFHLRKEAYSAELVKPREKTKKDDEKKVIRPKL